MRFSYLFETRRRLICVGFFDLYEFVQVVEKGVRQVGVKMPAPLFFEELDDPVHLPGFLIAAVTSQGIEYIRHRSDPAEDVRLLAFQLTGVAGAIPLFMVLAGSGSGACGPDRIGVLFPVLAVWLHGILVVTTGRLEVARVVVRLGQVDLDPSIPRLEISLNKKRRPISGFHGF